MATVMEWQTMKDGDEKYQAYLASREWALLKAAVRKRSGGVCEHCMHAPGTETHHQTYIRKYHERLSDLLHVCGPCHRYKSLPDMPDPRDQYKSPEKPYRFAFQQEGSFYGKEVECPGCHGDWNCVHLHVPPVVESSTKYDVLTIQFDCECGCEFLWTLTSGKGNTYIESEITGSSRPR